MRHEDRLLNLLLERGTQGVNSFDPIRNTMRQMPFVISVLRDRGYVIHSKDEPNQSTTYRLMHVPAVLKKEAKLTRQEAALEPVPEPTMFQVPSQQDIKEKLATLSQKLVRLRDEYRRAQSITDQKIIIARASALKNAIYKIDPEHPSLVAKG